MSDKPTAARRVNADSSMRATLETLAAKPAPAAETAEQVVLGSILQRPAVAEKVVDILAPEDFHAESHRVLFTEILAVLDEAAVPELELVCERLAGKGLLNAAGGIDYVASLPDAAPEPDNIVQYAKIVHDRAGQRHIIRAAVATLQSAYQPGNRTPSDVIADASQRLFDVADRHRAKGEGLRNVRFAVADAISQIEIAYAREDKDEPLGLPSGFTDLDQRTLGFQRGDLVIVAGRPGMGKTALCLNFAENAAKHTVEAIAVFSMEMGAAQLAMRMLASGTRIDATALRTGRIDNEAFERLAAQLGRYTADDAGKPTSPIYIDDSAGLTPMEVRARCQRLMRETGRPLGLIIVDYLQLMGGSHKEYEKEQVRIAEVSAALKRIARELNVPVIALAQLNRSLEGRVNKRPVMSDLRGAGEIEQDADLILLIYREDFYIPDTPDKGVCEIIIGKNRNGDIGEVRLTWVAEQQRFENHAFSGGY
jgi:replicative DNA helicase